MFVWSFSDSVKNKTNSLLNGSLVVVFKVVMINV